MKISDRENYFIFTKARLLFPDLRAAISVLGFLLPARLVLLLFFFQFGSDLKKISIQWKMEGLKLPRVKFIN